MRFPNTRLTFLYLVSKLKILKMAVLKSPRNNKKKKKWSLKYQTTFNTIPLPQAYDQQLRVTQQLHQVLSRTRLDNLVLELPAKPNQSLAHRTPFTKLSSSRSRPFYQHFKLSASTRRVGYPLLFQSIT